MISAEDSIWLGWRRLYDGRRQFWCTGVPPEFLAWLSRRPLEFQIVYNSAEDRHICRDTVMWIFEDPLDAHWCGLRFLTRKYDYFPEYYFGSWHAGEYFEYNDWWDDGYPYSEEMTWERSVGSLNLGSTGGCPMWQEGPRARPLARPRR